MGLIGKIALLFLLLSFSACAKTAQFDVLKSDIDSSCYSGVPLGTRFSWSVPESHFGRYSDIDVVNVMTATGELKGKPATVIWGKERSSGQWVVIELSTIGSEGWESLKRDDQCSVSEAEVLSEDADLDKKEETKGDNRE